MQQSWGSIQKKRGSDSGYEDSPNHDYSRHGNSKDGEQGRAEEVEAGVLQARNESLFALHTIPISSPAEGSVSSELFKIIVAEVRLVGGRGAVYKMCLLDMQGRSHQVEALGMDSLLTVSPAPEAPYLENRFQKIDHHGRREFQRPHGDVQLLLGMTLWSLYCTDGMEARKLRLNKSVFHPG